MEHPTSRRGGLAVMLAWALVLCGAAQSAAAAGPAPLRQAAAVTNPFAADLRACQAAIGGRLAQRRRLEAQHPRIAACLRQRGWSPDGTPSLDRLLAPG